MGVVAGVLALPAQPPPELEAVMDGVDCGGEGAVDGVVGACVAQGGGEVGLASGQWPGRGSGTDG